MKSIKMALLGGAALAVTAAAAHADDLDALKAQIETLNARVAAMEAAPSVPAGYALLSISEGDMKQIPGLQDSNDRALRALGPKATMVSVLPTADAPAGAVVTWSGRVVSSLTYYHSENDRTVSFSDPYDAPEVLGFGNGNWGDGQSGPGANAAYSEDGEYDVSDDDFDDLDVIANLRLRVTAATDTAVGEVGVTMEFRANFNGNGTGDAYFNEAWGYWAMTPELTLGGGYTGSLGNNSYGYDGVCSCYQTDYGDAFSLNPGDTTQMRLTYASGPFMMAVALEDAGAQGAFGNGSDNYNPNYDQLGVAGKIGYSGDMFNAAVSGLWRGVDNDSYAADQAAIGAYYIDSDGDVVQGPQFSDWPELEDTWQLNAGVGFGLGDIAKVSVGASIGSGPTTSTDEGVLETDLPIQNDWWGVSGALIFNLTDQFSAELGAAYKHRETESGLVYYDGDDEPWEFDGADYDTWAVAGGLYYTPVEQLTLGIEGQWTTSETNLRGDELFSDGTATGDTIDIDSETDTYLLDFTGVWRF